MNSQNDEERVILDYFGDFKGTFLDLGANDGLTLSNTYALAERGWMGVLVEPSPMAFGALAYNYANTRFIVYQLALGKYNGVFPFYESGTLLNQGDAALVSTLNKSNKNKFEKVVDYHEVEVECMTWDKFIIECPVKHFDFISMDIEGSELDVLPLMDLSKTRLLCIEHNSKDHLRKQYEKYLSGFSLIHITSENLIYGR